MLHTGAIDDISEIHSDVRPGDRLGTVEIQICDGMISLKDISAITAWTHRLVHKFAMSLEAGYKIPLWSDSHRVENKRSAVRYGFGAIINLDAQGDELLL